MVGHISTLNQDISKLMSKYSLNDSFLLNASCILCLTNKCGSILWTHSLLMDSYLYSSLYCIIFCYVLKSTFSVYFLNVL